MSQPPRPFPIHAPMHQFPVRDGELIVGGQRLSLLAERVGQTPFYAYDHAAQVSVATMDSITAQAGNSRAPRK